MADSIIATTFGIAFKQQSIKDSPDFIKGWLRSELGHGKGIGCFSQLVDLIIIGKLKADFHLMHRGRAVIARAPAVIKRKPVEYPFDMFVGRLLKVRIRKVDGLIKKHIGGFFVHINLNLKGGVR